MYFGYYVGNLKTITLKYIPSCIFELALCILKLLYYQKLIFYLKLKVKQVEPFLFPLHCLRISFHVHENQSKGLENRTVK